jgi:hypothetical protein
MQKIRPLSGVGATTLCLALHAVAAPAQDTARGPSPDHGLEVYLSEDALQAMYSRSIQIGELDNAVGSAGFFINENRDLIGIAELLGDVGNGSRQRSWSARFGPRAYGALLSQEDQDIFALGVGGKVSYYFGADRLTSVSLSAYYAPDIVTFGNADNVTDVGAEFQTDLNENLRIFVGYRTFEIDLPVDREVDDGLHLGVRGEF